MYIADLHIHSSYSRATAKNITPELLELWGRKKGIKLIGTGDFTHFEWRKELSEKLVPAEDGFYILKDEYRLYPDKYLSKGLPRFVVTGEISSIYKQGGSLRKVHSLILLPGLEDARRVSARLETIGNIRSDGRPILGLSCHDLLELTLESCPDAIYVPAHIWTPHFSLLGAFSGFDTVEECFGDLSGHIHAVETGLSSDPLMNRRLSMLDKYQLISNSDAHSPSKLGREATIFSGELSYDGLYKGIQRGDGLYGTVEFYPEEGKYHLDGHRKCHICLKPSETKAYNGICPVCGRRITIGVLHRVEELSDRPEGYRSPGIKPFESLIPLNEVIASACGRSAESARVKQDYEELILKLGSEFEILRETPIEDIRRAAGGLVAEGVKRLREGKVSLRAGFDGEYGRVSLFDDDERENAEGQMSFAFLESAERKAEKAEPWRLSCYDKCAEGAGNNSIESGKTAASDKKADTETDFCINAKINAKKAPMSQDAFKDRPLLKNGKASVGILTGLNEKQRLAVENIGRVTAVSAGPGTGKTRTLIAAIVYRLRERGVRPSEITALTFTNKAADEMKERLRAELKGKARLIKVGTIHSICMEILKNAGEESEIADEFITKEIAEETIKDFNIRLETKDFLKELSLIKNKAEGYENISEEAFRAYAERLRAEGLMDFDDIILRTLELLRRGKGKELKGNRFSYIFADELQDVGGLEYELIKALFEGGRELFAIGDSDQSIYGFRGAFCSCFESLCGDFPDTRLIRLTENYRSTEDIVNASARLISNNAGGERKLYAAKSGASERIKLIKAKSELSSAIFIAKEINKKVGGIDMLDRDLGGTEDDRERARSFSDIAVLYRSNYQAALLEKCLRKEGISYTVSGREDFLSDDKVRACVLFFRYALFGDEYSGRLCRGLLCGASENAVSSLVMESLAEKYRELSRKKKPEETLKAWSEETGLSQNESIDKLIKTSIFYGKMTDFIEALSQGADGDLTRLCDRTGKRYGRDCVRLMTVHAAKGLEFPVVFIFGAEEGNMPLKIRRDLKYKDAAEKSDNAPSAEKRKPLGHEGSFEACGTDVESITDLKPQEERGEEYDDLEEERRIFFVAMTRAKEELYINTVSGKESVFIGEIPAENMITEDAPAYTASDREKGEDKQMSIFDFMK